MPRLKPGSVAGVWDAKAEALAYLEARTKATAKARAKATAKAVRVGREYPTLRR
jgi:hypothetical protein